MANEQSIKRTSRPLLTQKESREVSNALVQFIDNAATLRREAIATLLNPGKNINHECGYPDSITLSEYREMYDREGIATKVVKILPEESWSSPPFIYETEKSDVTKFEAAWKQLETRLRLFQFMERIDVLSGIGRFGALMLGVGDGQDLSEPLNGINPVTGEKTGNAQHQLLYLRAFDENVVTIKKKESDNTSPRYGQPTMYGIQFETVRGTTSSQTTKQVHWTRVVHVADNRDTSEVYGTPRMKPVYNRLLDLRKILGGSGEMFWKGGFPGYAAEIDPTVAPQVMEDAVLRTAIKDSILAQTQDWFNSMQRVLAVSGVNFKSLQPQVSDPKSHVEIMVKMIAITLGIPYRVFLGTEEAKLASTQDVRTWNRRLKKRQESYLTPMLIRPLVDRLILLGILPEPKEYFVQWPDLDALTDQEVAEVAKNATEALAKYVAGGVQEIIPPLQYLTTILKMDEELAIAIIKEADLFNEDRDEDEPPEPEPEDNGEEE